MANISEITQGASYKGDSGLGGYSGGGAFEIDLKPVEELAQYTYLYNKAQYDQRQKDADEKVKQLAEMSAYDLVNGYGTDKEKVINAQAELHNKLATYAKKGTPKNPKEKIEQELWFQTQISDQTKLINSANGRAISYMTQKNAINNDVSTSAAYKEQKLKELDDNLKNTDIYTPIPALPKYTQTVIDIPAPVVQKFDLLGIGGDQNIKTKGGIYNPALNSPVADATVFGIKKAYPQKGTSEYDNLSPAQKIEADNQATVESSGKIWSDMTEPFNTVLQSKGIDGKLLYFDDKGNFNAAKFEDNNAANSVVMKAYNGLKNLNDYSHTKFAQLSDAKGIFTDKGVQYQLPTNLNAKDFKAGFINFNKGVTAAQLVQAGMFGKYQGDTYEKDVTETGKATQMRIEQTKAWNAYRIADLPYIYEKIKDQSANKDQKAAYPILKTQEFVNDIGTTKKNYSDLTPEQQERIKTQVDRRITNLSGATVSINGNKIIVEGNKSLDAKDTKNITPVSIEINLDDITKGYYDDINKNDAGKESVQRIHFDQSMINKPKEEPKTAKLSDYSSDIQNKIKTFMKMNKVTTEDEAIKILKEQGIL